jgi:hypothetical protein
LLAPAPAQPDFVAAQQNGVAAHAVDAGDSQQDREGAASREQPRHRARKERHSLQSVVIIHDVRRDRRVDSLERFVHRTARAAFLTEPSRYLSA